MKRILAPLLGNAALAALVFMMAATSPRDAAAVNPIRDCCQCSVEGVSWCCDNCCWITNDCPSGSEECFGSCI